jgi:hypothetical protein
MTPKDVQAMEKALLECRAAVDEFERSMKEGKSRDEIGKALENMEAKQKVYWAFREKHFAKYPQN